MDSSDDDISRTHEPNTNLEQALHPSFKALRRRLLSFILLRFSKVANKIVASSDNDISRTHRPNTNLEQAVHPSFKALQRRLISFILVRFSKVAN
jgi:hypothetical protein